jgi:DNA-binding MarR family transcriptional regulator
MATIEVPKRFVDLKKFAEQVFRVEAVLSKQGLPGSAAKVVYLLTVAGKPVGVSQKEVVAEIALPKFVVSKLVSSLVAAGLLSEFREASNRRIKRLATTDTGLDLLFRLKAALQAPLPAVAQVGVRPTLFSEDV